MHRLYEPAAAMCVSSSSFMVFLDFLLEFIVIIVLYYNQYIIELSNFQVINSVCDIVHNAKNLYKCLPRFCCYNLCVDEENTL